MIKTFTLEDAISQVFSVDGVPQFRTYKPVQEAREWLQRNEIEFDYERSTLKDGIVFFAFGSGQPQIAVVDGDGDRLKGAMILATLSPKKKVSKVGTVKVTVNVDEAVADKLEEVTTEKAPKKKRTRRTRRSK